MPYTQGNYDSRPGRNRRFAEDWRRFVCLWGSNALLRFQSCEIICTAVCTVFAVVCSMFAGVQLPVHAAVFIVPTAHSAVQKNLRSHDPDSGTQSHSITTQIPTSQFMSLRNASSIRHQHYHISHTPSVWPGTHVVQAMH
jgi:hypothetical protein